MKKKNRRVLGDKKIQVIGLGWKTQKEYLNLLKYGENPKVSKRSESEAKKVDTYFNENYYFPSEKTKKPGKKVITAPPIEYNQSEINKLRKLVRKKDGTFFDKNFYARLAKKTQGKNEDEVADI